MKKLLLLITCFALTHAITGQGISTPPNGGNQHCAVTQYIGSIVQVTVDYHSPDVTGPNGEDRTGQIWGQLVPYGLTDLGFGLRTPAPWRAGANENTTITFSHDVLIQGEELKAGTYGLHLIVAESGPWTWIFSKDNKSWGSYFYIPEHDALRVETEAQDSDFHEWLTYQFTDRQATTAELSLLWENKRIPMSIAIQDPTELTYAVIDGELKGSAGFNYQNWVGGSAYLTQQNYKLDKALEWADAAVSAPFVGQRNWATLQNKATIQTQMGDSEGSQATMDEALGLESATAFQIHGYGRQLIGQGHPDKALEVFQMNHEKFDGAWPTNVGLARGYSAVGEYEKALKYAKLAHDEAPDDLNKNSMAQAVEKLEQKQDIN